MCVMKAHRHHILGEHEAMLENHQPGSDSIVSSPAQLEEIVKKGAKPIVIVFGDGQKRFYPINFGDFARLPELTDNGRSVNSEISRRCGKRLSA